MRWMRVTLLLIALFLAPSPTWSQANSADEQAIRRVLAHFRAAFDEADVTKYRALHAPSALVVDLGVVSTSRDELAGHFKADLTGAYKGFRFTAFDMSTVRVLNATTAMASGTWEATVPGQPPLKGIVLMVLGKHGSNWLVEGWHSALRAE
jgi:uncharacterized protein (TIGR02246 family)